MGIHSLRGWRPAPCLCLALALWAGGPAARGDEEGPEASPAVDLESTAWDVTAMIADGAAWADCARRLTVDLAAASPDAPYATRCRDLLTGVQLNLADPAPVHAATEPAGDEWTLSQLIAALPEARVPPLLLVRPLQVSAATGQSAWRLLAERAAPGAEASAYHLYLRGPAAIPALIAALGDQRATRTALTDRTRYPAPAVARVGDVALAVIEGITNCRLHLTPTGFNVKTGDAPFFTAWAEARRAEQVAAVQRWWAATQPLSPEERMAWQLERADRSQMLEMAEAAVSIGLSQAVRPFLRTHFRADGELDFEVARLAVRAGAREPLDFVQQVLDTGQPVTDDMVRLIAEVGELDDFKHLRDALLIGRRAARIDPAMVVNQLMVSDQPLVLPVLIAVIAGDESTHAGVGAPAVPAHLLRAAERVQQISGRDFGFGKRNTPYVLARGFDEILRWWEREGRAAFDYEQIRPQAPGGIR